MNLVTEQSRSKEWEGRTMSQGVVFGNRWWIVFGATLSMLVAQGPVILYTLGLFIKSLNQEFGWDRASISAAGGLLRSLPRSPSPSWDQ